MRHILILSSLALAVASCAELPPIDPKHRISCTYPGTTIGDALAAYLEKDVWRDGFGTDLEAYFEREKRRVPEFIAFMREKDALSKRAMEQCVPAEAGRCTVVVSCKEDVINARRAPTTFTLIMNQQNRNPIKLLRRFDSETDPIYRGSIVFR